MKCNGLHRGLKKNFQTHEAEAEGNRACESRGLCQNRRLAQRRANDQHGLSACFYSPEKKEGGRDLALWGRNIYFPYMEKEKNRTNTFPYMRQKETSQAAQES